MSDNNVFENCERNGNKVRNPITNRWIIIGGPTYNKMLSDKANGVKPYTKNKVIYEGTESEAKNVIMNLKKNKTPLYPGKELVLRKNKVMTKNKMVTKQMIKERSKELAIDIYKENPDMFAGLTPEQVVIKIQEIIKERLIRGNNEVSQKMQYIIENIESEDDSEYEDESEYEDGEEIAEETETGEISDEEKESEGVELEEDGDELKEPELVRG